MSISLLDNSGSDPHTLKRAQVSLTGIRNVYLNHPLFNIIHIMRTIKQYLLRSMQCTDSRTYSIKSDIAYENGTFTPYRDLKTD